MMRRGDPGFAGPRTGFVQSTRCVQSAAEADHMITGFRVLLFLAACWFSETAAVRLRPRLAAA